MNFILFMPDTLRAESVGCYGNDLVATPNMDRLAGEGVRFEQCHVQHPACVGSRCSLMSGWYPHVMGHRSQQRALHQTEPNLFRYLKNAGYDIRMYGRNHALNKASCTDSTTEGAQGYSETHEYGNAYQMGDPEYYSFLYKAHNRPEKELGDYKKIQHGIEFLQSEHTQPFLLQLNLDQPHPPYYAPAEFHNRVDPDLITDLRPYDLPNRPCYHEGIRRYRNLDDVDDAILRKVNAVYLGQISWIDTLLGRILRTLKETGLDRDTMVIVFSDHGDYAGDHGLVEKWSSGMEDVLTRIPLIVRMPQGADNLVIEDPVEMLDLFATIMECAGLEANHPHFSTSLLPQLKGAPYTPKPFVFCEGGFGLNETHLLEGGTNYAEAPDDIYFPKFHLQHEEPVSIARAVMMRNKDYKLVYRPEDVCEFYDLRKDPRELDNCYGKPETRQQQQTMESELLKWLVTTSDVPLRQSDTYESPHEFEEK